MEGKRNIKQLFNTSHVRGSKSTQKLAIKHISKGYKRKHPFPTHIINPWNSLLQDATKVKSLK